MSTPHERLAAAHRRLATAQRSSDNPITRAWADVNDAAADVAYEIGAKAFPPPPPPPGLNAANRETTNVDAAFGAVLARNLIAPGLLDGLERLSDEYGLAGVRSAVADLWNAADALSRQDDPSAPFDLPLLPPLVGDSGWVGTARISDEDRAAAAAAGLTDASPTDNVHVPPSLAEDGITGPRTGWVGTDPDGHPIFATGGMVSAGRVVVGGGGPPEYVLPVSWQTTVDGEFTVEIGEDGIARLDFSDPRPSGVVTWDATPSDSTSQAPTISARNVVGDRVVDVSAQQVDLDETSVVYEITVLTEGDPTSVTIDIDEELRRYRFEGNEARRMRGRHRFDRPTESRTERIEVMAWWGDESEDVWIDVWLPQVEAIDLDPEPDPFTEFSNEDTTTT